MGDGVATWHVVFIDKRGNSNDVLIAASSRAEAIDGARKRGAVKLRLVKKATNPKKKAPPKEEVEESAIPANHVGDASGLAGLGSPPPVFPNRRKKRKPMRFRDYVKMNPDDGSSDA